MNNYVLNRTNVLLGGQMKWDLRVKSLNNSTLYVDDFSLTPISRNINYVRPDVGILNNNHHDNIKELYSKTSDTFFSDCLDAKFITKYPIIVDDDKAKANVDSYNSMYDNCVSRISRAKNGKSMQLFIPMWLEDFGPSDTIKFDIELFIEDDSGNKTTSIYKTLKLNVNEKYSHNNFVNYMKSYIESISTNNKIGDKIINIDFKNLKMVVEGIDLKTGHILTKDISNKLHNFTGLYKPFIDNDDMIIRSLSDNNLVAKQLFNFNIMFDFEDILSKYILDQIKGASVKFNVKTYVNKVEVEEKSFSWDYSENFNNGALKELQDYNNIQLIDKNKINTNVIHWTLNKDGNYVFNMYPNMTTLTNLWTKNYSEDKTCINWCNNDILLDKKRELWTDFKNNSTLYDNIVKNLKIEDFTVFTNEKEIINNIYYNKDLDKNVFNKELRIYLLVLENGSISGENSVSSKCIDSLPTNSCREIDFQDVELYAYMNAETTNYVQLILITEEQYLSYLSFKSITENADILQQISEFLKEKKLIFNLKEKLSNYVESCILPFNYTAYPIPTNCPLQYINNCNENEFIKTYIPEQYLFRYDGGLSPMFVDPKDNQYWQIKKIDRDEYVKDWDDLIKTKFLPLYPSINYFYIETINKNDYKFEKNWFEESNVYVLQSIINLTYTVDLLDNKTEESISEYIKRYVQNYYNIKDEDVLNYTYNMYNIKYKYDYSIQKINGDNVYKYVYNISLILK